MTSASIKPLTLTRGPNGASRGISARSAGVPVKSKSTSNFGQSGESVEEFCVTFHKNYNNYFCESAETKLTDSNRRFKKVLTSCRHRAGAAGLWRYIIRAAIVARLDKLSAALRKEDARAEDAATEAARRRHQHQQGTSPLYAGGGGGKGGEYGSAVCCFFGNTFWEEITK